MKKLIARPGTIALASSIAAVLWGVKFILRYINRVCWDTCDWVVNLSVAALLTITAAEWLVKWAIDRKNGRRVQ